MYPYLIRTPYLIQSLQRIIHHKRILHYIKINLLKIKTFFIGLLLLAPGVIFAQLPGGSILWLIADSVKVQGINKISLWPDNSGKINTVTQINAGSQPSLVSNVLNGHAAVKFHGGGEYLSGPPIFPHNHDYTIVTVLRIDDSTNINNILSGNSHALFFGSSLYPRAVHGNFLFQLVSSLKVDTEFAIVTIRYSDNNAQAKLYVNGQSGDSLFILSNSDSTIYIGAYQGAYTLNGAIAELALFDRQITESERNQFESSLRLKYGIKLGKPVPKPDSTFTSLPASLQLYPRQFHDSATVPINGTIYQQGFDTIYLDVFKNKMFSIHQAIALQYSEAKAPFFFNPQIHAELSEYRFVVHLKNVYRDTIIADRDSVCSGDVYFIGGDSQSTFGFYTTPFQNEFCRTFGVNFSHNIRDTNWAISQANLWGDGPSVNGWALLLQKHLIEKYNMPSCFIDGGTSGTVIIYHLRNEAIPMSLETIYGRMLYRARKGNIASQAKGIFWYQGGLDFKDQYFERFQTLYNSWLKDYPNLHKRYVIQFRPSFCVNREDNPLRDLQRTIGDSLQGFESISSTMFPFQDGCHFHDDGFPGISDQLFPIIARDFYHSIDTIGISSPNITKAFYTTPQNNQIALVFTPHNCGISATNDTIVSGITATIKDYFYPNDELGKVQSVQFSGDTVFLTLYSSSNATFISHIPDRYYNGSDSVFYEGPWLKSSRGIGALLFFHFPIDNWKSSTNIPTNPNDFSLEVVSNPTQNLTSLRLHLPVESNLNLSVFNLLGKKILTLIDGKVSAGLHEIQFDATNLSAGEYFCRLQSRAKTLTAKIIITK